MFKITSSAAVFGPYNSVTEDADRWIVDGAVIPFSVVPDGAVSDWTQADEDARRAALAATNTPARTRADVLADLAAIDLKSIRALRESNATRIAELEAQAVALRAELAAL